MSVTPGAGERSFELFRKTPAVEKARQLIGKGETLKVLDPLVLGRDLLFRLSGIHQRALQKSVFAHFRAGFLVGDVFDQARRD